MSVAASYSPAGDRSFRQLVKELVLKATLVMGGYRRTVQNPNERVFFRFHGIWRDSWLLYCDACGPSLREDFSRK